MTPEPIAKVPRLMEAILVPLAFLGLFGGIFNLPDYLGGGWLARFFGTEAADLPHGPEVALQATAGALALAGLAIAHFLYGGKRRDARIEVATRPTTAVVSFFLAGWRFDDLYRFLFIRPYEALARFFWQRVDEGVIDDSLDRLAALLGRSGTGLGRWTTGRVSVYLMSFAAGLALIVVYFAWVVFM